MVELGIRQTEELASGHTSVLSNRVTVVLLKLGLCAYLRLAILPSTIITPLASPLVHPPLPQHSIYVYTSSYQRARLLFLVSDSLVLFRKLHLPSDPNIHISTSRPQHTAHPK